MKTVLVIRLGALGDLIIITSLLRQLKIDGYHITVCVKSYAAQVLQNNPNVNVIIKDNPPNDATLEKHWEDMGQGFDKVINLSGSIENNLMPTQSSELGRASKEERHKECNRNFYDETMKWGGYPEIIGQNGELFFSKSEHLIAVKYHKKYFSGRFLVLWSLSGSSIHKAYPFTYHVITALTRKYSNIVFITTGDEVCQILEQDFVNNPQVKCQSGNPIRKAMILTKYADCVVGPDTGIMHAAGCYDTPKIMLMSCNTEENISKYWKNQVTLHGECDCYPCHRLIYNAQGCVLDKELETPKCMVTLRPEFVFRAIEKEYLIWADRHLIELPNFDIKPPLEQGVNYGPF